MEVSLATSRIFDQRRKYMKRFYIFFSLGLIILVLIFLLFLLPLYLDVFWKDGLKYCFPYFYNQNNVFLQVLVFASLLIILVLALGLILLFVYLILNHYYKREYQKIFFSELKLNEITFNNEPTYSPLNFDIIRKINSLDRTYFQYLFSLITDCGIDLYESKIHNSLILITKFNTDIHGLFQLRSDYGKTVSYFDEKSVYEFNFDLKNSKKHLFVNSTFSKETTKMVNNDLLETFTKFRNFTKTKLIFTFVNDKIIIFIKNWNLHLVDPLFKKIEYDTLDKKVDAMTELIDYIIDIKFYFMTYFEKRR